MAEVQAYVAGNNCKTFIDYLLPTSLVPTKAMVVGMLLQETVGSTQHR